MNVTKEIEELNNLLRGRWVSGLWNLDHAERQSDPKTRVKPHLWKWQEVYDSLLQAREKISVARGSVERRVIRLVNPGMAETEMTSHTMLFSFQLIQPGEVASAHRHTMAAFRFILQGRGAYTNVDGQKMIMEEGDLILTPQWAWHEHAHEGDEPMVWIDGLDVPFIQSLQVISFQPYNQRRLAVSEGTDPQAYYGMTRPVGAAAQEHMPLLHPGERTKTHRHTSTSIYHAFRGSGTTTINGEPFHWEKGDTFIVPLWSWHEHLNRSAKEAAILFSVHDLPILKAFGLYREEGQAESAPAI